MYGLDLNDWLRGERDWRDLFEYLDELPLGSRYVACLQEDEELAELVPERRERPTPAESPSWREFDKQSYDMAEIKALLQQILVAACRGDPSAAGIEPWVPKPAADQIHREKRLTKLRATVAKATGR